MTGHDDDDTNKALQMDRQWVLSKGGEYFFSPSMEALGTVFAGAGAGAGTE